MHAHVNTVSAPYVCLSVAACCEGLRKCRTQLLSPVCNMVRQSKHNITHSCNDCVLVCVCCVCVCLMQVLHLCSVVAPNHDTTFSMSIVWTAIQLLCSSFFLNFSVVSPQNALQVKSMNALQRQNKQLSLPLSPAQLCPWTQCPCLHTMCTGLPRIALGTTWSAESYQSARRWPAYIKVITHQDHHTHRGHITPLSSHS